MTGKRFYIKQSESTGEYPVFDKLNDDECVAVSDVERVSQKTCDLLNELYNSDSTNSENERFKLSNDVLYEYNSLIDAWHTVDMKKLCIMLNKIDAMFYEFFEDMWLK